MIEMVALERGRDALLAMQHPDGWWKGVLETNVTMDAEDLLLRQFLGVLTPEQASATAAWIRSQQRDDGTWATFHGGPADLSTTVEAYTALRSRLAKAAASEELAISSVKARPPHFSMSSAARAAASSSSRLATRR